MYSNRQYNLKKINRKSCQIINLMDLVIVFATGNDIALQNDKEIYYPHEKRMQPEGNFLSNGDRL